MRRKKKCGDSRWDAQAKQKWCLVVKYILPDTTMHARVIVFFLGGAGVTPFLIASAGFEPLARVTSVCTSRMRALFAGFFVLAQSSFCRSVLRIHATRC